jgi:hypothetical protein
MALVQYFHAQGTFVEEEEEEDWDTEIILRGGR